MVRQGLFQLDNVCLGLSKWGLIIFNVVFWLMGVVSLCIGLWLYVAFNEFATFSNGERLIGSVLLVAVGFGALIVGFLGIVAAMWESRIIATGFCILMVLAMGMYVSSGGWALWQKSRLSQDTTGQLKQAIQDYDSITAYAQVWDVLQNRYNCCGVETVQDWENFRNPLISRPPPSCCADATCQVFHTVGCVQDLQQYERRQLDILGPIGLAFGAFQVVGVIVTVLFCSSLHNTKDSYYT